MIPMIKPYTFLFILVFSAILCVVIKLDYHVWKLEHPQAPAWVYIFK